ncbi:MAG: hypothetical protein QW059_02355 [Nitrososphaerota archaeon]
MDTGSRMVCARCGTGVKRLNIYRGEMLCDECYSKMVGGSEESCRH